jgi:hypothetical protein
VVSYSPVAAGSHSTAFNLGYFNAYATDSVNNSINGSAVTPPDEYVDIFFQRLPEGTATAGNCLYIRDYKGGLTQVGCNKNWGPSSQTVRVITKWGCNVFGLVLKSNGTIVQDTAVASNLPYIYVVRTGNTNNAIEVRANDNRDTTNPTDTNYLDFRGQLSFSKNGVPYTNFGIQSKSISCIP